MTSFCSLPTELILGINEHLPPASTVALLFTCSTFYRILGSEAIYRRAIACDESIYFKNAVHDGNARAIIGLVEAGGDPKKYLYPNVDQYIPRYRDRKTETLLHLCARRSNTAAIVPLLVNSGVNPFYDTEDESDIPQSTAVVIAARKGHLSVLKALLECMRDPRFELDGFTYEDDAWKQAWDSVRTGAGIRLCLEKSIEPTPTSQDTVDAAFRRAVGALQWSEPNSASAAEALLEAGAQPTGETVFAAVKHLRRDLVQIQLERGANPDHAEQTGCRCSRDPKLPKSSLLVALRKAVTRAQRPDYSDIDRDDCDEMTPEQKEELVKHWESIRINRAEMDAAEAVLIVNMLLRHGADVDLSTSLLKAFEALEGSETGGCFTESAEDVRVMLACLEKFREGGFL